MTKHLYHNLRFSAHHDNQCEVKIFIKSETECFCSRFGEGIEITRQQHKQGGSRSIFLYSLLFCARRRADKRVYLE